jgi:hypothetical protein
VDCGFTLTVLHKQFSNTLNITQTSTETVLHWLFNTDFFLQMCLTQTFFTDVFYAVSFKQAVLYRQFYTTWLTSNIFNKPEDISLSTQWPHSYTDSFTQTVLHRQFHEDSLTRKSHWKVIFEKHFYTVTITNTVYMQIHRHKPSKLRND